jgi:hypothetical protein
MAVGRWPSEVELALRPAQNGGQSILGRFAVAVREGDQLRAIVRFEGIDHRDVLSYDDGAI